MNMTEKILSRCEQDGDCLIWQGAKHRQGYGMVRIDGNMQTVHRVIGLEAYGHPGKSTIYKFTHTCGNPLCCNADHITVKTHSDLMQDIVPTRKLKRAKNVELTPELVLEIRNAPDNGWGTNARLAKKYGLSNTTIGRIRSGESYNWIQ
jgi:hypothetical protein